MPTVFGTPEHWRSRAEEARTIAEQMNDPDAKRAMLEITARYEHIAKRAEARDAGVDMHGNGGRSDA
jgi:hypothetical protein